MGVIAMIPIGFLERLDVGVLTKYEIPNDMATILLAGVAILERAFNK